MFALLDNQLSSAFFAGFADQKWVAEVSAGALDWVKAGFARVSDLAKGIQSLAVKVIDTGKGIWNFFVKWFKDDPIGAVAGAGLVVATGVLLFMGATALGSVIGGLGGLGALKGMALAAAGAFVNNLLQNPVGKLIRFFVKQVQFLYNFDWNQTDEDLKKQQQNNIASLYGKAGEALGTALGGTICGILPGVAAVRMNLANMATMWQILDDDVKDEILSEFNALFNTTKRILADNFFKEAYMNVRKWIKANEGIRSFIRSINPDFDKAIEYWGSKDSKPFTFAKAVEDAIEGIKDVNLRKFTEGLVENFMESCSESLIAISYAL